MVTQRSWERRRTEQTGAAAAGSPTCWSFGPQTPHFAARNIIQKKVPTPKSGQSQRGSWPVPYPAHFRLSLLVRGGHGMAVDADPMPQ